MVGTVLIIVILASLNSINLSTKDSSSNLENKTISQKLSSSNKTQVTLTGTVQQIINDCAPSRNESQQHCVLLKIIVLRAADEHSYILSNMNFSSQLQDKQLLVVGTLTIPSTTNMTFIYGDVNVIKYTIMENNPSNQR